MIACYTQISKFPNHLHFLKSVSLVPLFITLYHMPSLEWTVINWCIWDPEVYAIVVYRKFSTHEFMVHVPCSEYSRKFYGSVWNEPFLMASSWTIWTWTFPNHIWAVIWVQPLIDMIPPSSLPRGRAAPACDTQKDIPQTFLLLIFLKPFLLSGVPVSGQHHDPFRESQVGFEAQIST